MQGYIAFFYFFITAFLTFGILLHLRWHSLQASLDDRLNHMPRRFKDGKNGKKRARLHLSASTGLHFLDKDTNPCTLLCLDSCSTICLRAGQHMLCGRMIFLAKKKRGIKAFRFVFSTQKTCICGCAGFHTLSL